MSKKTQAILRSWFNAFVAAVITALIITLTDTKTLALDWNTIQAIIISGLVAVLPVIRNYFDKNDTRYGRGSDAA